MGNLFGKEKVDGAPSKAVQDGRSKVSDHDRAVLVRAYTHTLSPPPVVPHLCHLWFFKCIILIIEVAFTIMLPSLDRPPPTSLLQPCPQK